MKHKKLLSVEVAFCLYLKNMVPSLDSLLLSLLPRSLFVSITFPSLSLSCQIMPTLASLPSPTSISTHHQSLAPLRQLQFCSAGPTSAKWQFTPSIPTTLSEINLVTVLYFHLMSYLAFPGLPQTCFPNR